MEPSDYEAALKRITNNALRTSKLDSTTDEIILAQLVTYSFTELRLKGISTDVAFRAMTNIERSPEKVMTDQAITQAYREIRNDTPPSSEAQRLRPNLNTLPEEILRNIVRYALLVFNVILQGNHTDPNTSYNRWKSPDLHLLLVNRKIHHIAASLPAGGIVVAPSFDYANFGLRRASVAKRRLISRLEVHVKRLGYPEELPPRGNNAHWAATIDQAESDCLGKLLKYLYEESSVEERSMLYGEGPRRKPLSMSTVQYRVGGYGGPNTAPTGLSFHYTYSGRLLRR